MSQNVKLFVEAKVIKMAANYYFLNKIPINIIF